MHKVAVATMEGYREWTEALGDDREWKIQGIQSTIERIASEEAAKCNSFYLPQRRDVLVFVANGVDTECLRGVASKIERVAPVPLRFEVRCGPSPLEALRGNEGDCETGPIAAVHVDLNGFTKEEPYTAYVRALNVYVTLINAFFLIGAIGSYLGGDNFLFFVDPSQLGAIERMGDIVEDVKIGIGIGENAREAVAKAAASLRYLRENRNAKFYLTS